MRKALLLLVVALVLSSGTSRGDDVDDSSSTAMPREVRQILGEGVVGTLEDAQPLGDPATVARWETGEWVYRMTVGDRRGETEREILAPVERRPRGETWRRRVGRDFTLYLSQTADGSLVLPSELVHTHKALVFFEPPLSYLMASLRPGESRVFDGKMDVYRESDPTSRWYSGRIRATTVYAGAYRITTPAGTFTAILIRTDYKIDIFAVVSVTDRLYTFYAEGVGKVAEAEHRHISAIGLFSSNTQIGKVLVAYPSATPIPSVQAP